MEGWLFLIARNAVADYYRKLKSHEELPADLAAETDEPEFEQAEQLRVAFRRMIEQLPPPYGEALVLTEFKGLTQKELAEHLGISISAAKARVQRGRVKLKEALLDCCQLEFDRRGQIIECTPTNESCCQTE